MSKAKKELDGIIEDLASAGHGVNADKRAYEDFLLREFGAFLLKALYLSDEFKESVDKTVDNIRNTGFKMADEELSLPEKMDWLLPTALEPIVKQFLDYREKILSDL